MKKNKEIGKFKNFYQNKNGKAILFFSFYLVFFLFLAFFIKKVQENVYKENNINNNQEVQTKLYTIKDLYDNNFTYQFEIQENGLNYSFNGSKDKIDYDNFENKYFLSFVNINQLIKKGKLVSQDSDTTTYEISNIVLNEILDTSRSEGINTIVLVSNTNGLKIIMELSNYMEKALYNITLNYRIGD